MLKDDFRGKLIDVAYLKKQDARAKSLYGDV